MSKPDDIVFPSKIESGKLIIVGRRLFDQRLLSLPDGGYELILRKKGVRRSNAMNRYYWGCMIKMIVDRFRELGTQIKLDAADEWIRDILLKTNGESFHQLFKELFIENIEVDEETGEIKKKNKTTRNITNVEFIEFYTPIYEYAATKLDLQIPFPNENFET